MKRKTKLILWGICAFWSAVLGGLLYLRFVPLLKVEYTLRDQNVRSGAKAPLDERIVYLGLDEKTLNILDELWEDELQDHPALTVLAETSGATPKRHFFAHVIQRLCDAGAKVVILDFVFGKTHAEDDVLAQTIEKYKDHVVVGANWTDVFAGDGINTGKRRTLTLPADTVVRSPELMAQCTGIVNFFTDDVDGIVRSYYPQMGYGSFNPLAREGDVFYDALARRAAIQSESHLEKNPKGDDSVYFRFAGPPETIARRPLYEIFAKRTWERNFGNGEGIKGKVVMVGPAANILQDFHKTPFKAPMLGPELHLNATNAILQNQFLYAPANRWDLWLVPLAGVIAGLLNRFISQSLIRFSLSLLGAFAFIALTRVAYNHWDLYLVGTTPALCLLLSTVTSLSYEIVVERMEKARVRSTLELYVSKNVANEIMRNMESFKNTLVGARKPVTILFSDIRGFTGLTEGADEQKLVEQLNQYFARMVDHGVQEHKGTLHKFIGDAIMAVWGDTVTAGPQEDACRAVRAALAMRRELPGLNDKWDKEGRPRLKIGIGVNFGTVVVGDIGSEQRREFTVMGDAVNVASRLEGATKEFKTDMLIGEEVFGLVKDHFLLRTAGRMVVKGKSKPLTAYEPVAEITDPAPRFTKQEVEAFESAVNAYYSACFTEALAGFEVFLQKHPDDTLGARFAEACREFIIDPPEPGWDGVERLKTK